MEDEVSEPMVVLLFELDGHLAKSRVGVFQLCWLC